MIFRSLWLERMAPMLLAVATFCAVAYWRADISVHFGGNGWKPENLYSAVFNWASIQSGFVFGIYGFIASKQSGFVGEIDRIEIFNHLLAYSRRAYVTGFALTFTSLPMLVVVPSISNYANPAFWVVAVWFSCFIWTFCAFLRVAFVFGMIVATPDRPQEIVG